MNNKPDKYDTDEPLRSFAHLRGYNTYKEWKIYGVGEVVNPYEEGTQKHSDWDEGVKDAKEDLD